MLIGLNVKRRKENPAKSDFSLKKERVLEPFAAGEQSFFLVRSRRYLICSLTRIAG